jgi:hypothetical protein
MLPSPFFAELPPQGDADWPSVTAWWSDLIEFFGVLACKN